MILSIDPGICKCGIAVLDESGKVVYKAIIESRNMAENIPKLVSKYVINKIILGEGTYSGKIKQDINKLGIDVILIKEANSSIEARALYFKQNPPKGILRFFPRSLLVPPMPIDDYAAIVLAQRYLKS